MDRGKLDYALAVCENLKISPHNLYFYWAAKCLTEEAKEMSEQEDCEFTVWDCAEAQAEADIDEPLEFLQNYYDNLHEAMEVVYGPQKGE